MQKKGNFEVGLICNEIWEKIFGKAVFLFFFLPLGSFFRKLKGLFGGKKCEAAPKLMVTPIRTFFFAFIKV